MIPRVIHYCWFGHRPLPRLARRCVASWQRHFPGYEIRRWDETNYDVNTIPYTREAYAQGKYAFVSDFARFDILYRHGGLYFDTDVEVIRPFDDLLAIGPFMGMEEAIGVAPGLGLGAEAGHPLYKEVLELYRTLSFEDETVTVVTHTTDVLRRHGFTPKDEPQLVCGLWIYPNDYFNPLDDATGRLRLTPNSRSIHWYAKTWVDHYGPLRNWATRLAHRLLGVNTLRRLLHRR